eukprot:TRINITY_DN39711_c0_g1_i1.p2 TRINITY_DN39711_c0_g1~~TRINITY_DN39711_c0_g1_i1.p2  ORF type:complete len:230 (-),score=57.70 TRINITY_DN39711_c0_g1_i1:174-794(-)
MAARILLVRHGQDEDNAEKLLNGHRDRPLTALGREQAQTLMERLRTNGYTGVPDAVVTSPLQRARETGRAIYTGLGLEEQGKPFEEWPEMIERDFGVLSGQPLSDIPKYAGDNVLQTDKVTYFLEVEGAETFPVLLERAEKVLAKVNETFKDKTVVLVGHGDINKMIRTAYYGWTWKEGLLTPYVDNTAVIELPSAEAAAARGSAA